MMLFQAETDGRIEQATNPQSVVHRMCQRIPLPSYMAADNAGMQKARSQ
jgi:hypothetical protein